MTAVMVVAMAMAFGVALPASPGALQDVDDNVLVEILVRCCNKQEPDRVMVWQKWLQAMPFEGLWIFFDEREPAEEVVRVQVGPLKDKSNRTLNGPSIQYLVWLRSAEGCCLDWVGRRAYQRPQ